MRVSNKIIGWSLCLIFATCGPLRAQERSPQDIEKSCRQAVQRFYNRFVGKGPKYPSAMLSRELRRQLKDDQDHKMDENGLIAGLDWDPIAQGNDICTRYETGKVTRKGDRYLVEVFCVWDNERDKGQKMRHEVMFSRGRWVIVNIHYYIYEKGKLTSDSDLLSILKKIREGRRKNPE